MPRDGSNVYSPDWVPASPNTTIESAKVNAMVADFVVDANSPRPITAGGTGETTARLKDGTWRFQNSTDQTKLLAFDLSGLTTATTRTLTAQDKSGAMAVTSDLNGLLFGLEMVNSGVDANNDIAVGSGKAASTAAVPVLMTLSSTLIKQLDANWAAGTNQGMRYSGAAIANGTYHIYAVCKALGADTDIYADPSADESTVLTHLQAETGGSAYVGVRRIGSILREAGSIVAFSQKGDEFLRQGTIPRDVNVVNLGTTGTLYTLSVPIGVKVRAIVTGWVSNAAAGTQVLITSPDQTDQAPSGNGSIVASAGGYGGVSREVRTNTSGQIRARADGASTSLSLGTHGWIDTRGRT